MGLIEAVHGGDPYAAAAYVACCRGTFSSDTPSYLEVPDPDLPPELPDVELDAVDYIPWGGLILITEPSTSTP